MSGPWCAFALRVLAPQQFHRFGQQRLDRPARLGRQHLEKTMILVRQLGRLARVIHARRSTTPLVPVNLFAEFYLTTFLPLRILRTSCGHDGIAEKTPILRPGGSDSRDAFMILWKYTPDKWGTLVAMRLARHDNLPGGCLVRWLNKILQ